jgi:general L-amino acid transport system permease protein
VLNSLALALVCAGFATVLGIVIGAARLSSNWLAARLAALYVEVFRNVPALLQVFFWYYVVLRMLPGPREAIAVFDLAFLSNRGLYLPAPRFGVGALLALGAVAGAALLILPRGSGPHCAHRVRGLRGLAWVLAISGLAGLGLTASWDVPQLGRYTYAGGARLLPEFLAVALGLSFYNAAYIAEITRGGIQSVVAGQREAALSLGLDAIQTLRFVVLPQALRVMLPPLASIYVNLFKASSIGAAVGYPEVVSVMVGTTNNLVGRPVEIMALTLAVYASVSLVAAGLMNRYHARLERDPEMRQ